jgi:2-polyprenyl-3-methyl-5-hydroxy-6-metoxy-1,4-benzoquinol methylase
MKPIDKDSRVGWITHTYGPIDPNVYFNHLGVMLRWSKQFNMVFIGIDKHRAADARNILVRTAQAMKCTHLLVVDADHILPNHMLECLSLNEDAKIVSGLITKRKPPYSQVGFVKDSENPEEGYFPVDLKIDNQSYLVDIPAMGCTLIDIDIFDDLEEPYFFDSLATKSDGTRYNKRSDSNFFESVRAKGHKIIIDTRVLVGHMKDAEAVFPNCVPDVKDLNRKNKIRSKDDSLKRQKNVYDLASSLVQNEEKLAVLDLGCGNPVKLLTSFPKLDRAFGIDFPEKILSIATAANGSNHKFLGYDLDDLIDLKEKFDLVICSDVIEHVNDPDMLLENAKRHMDDESILVISSPEKRTTNEINYLHVREFTFEELSALLCANDFEIIEHKEYQEMAITPYTNNIFVCKLKRQE